MIQVAVGWSGYFVQIFQEAFNVDLADSWTQPTVNWTEVPAAITYQQGHYFNVPGFVIVLLATLILCLG